MVVSEKQAEQELALALKEWEIAYERIQALIEPEGVYQLFAILGFIAGVGLIIPLAIMASNPTVVPAAIRVTLVLLFTVGVAVLFYYFWRLARLSTTVTRD